MSAIALTRSLTRGLTCSLTYGRATSADEFEQVFRLNHATFTGEIPQHAAQAAASRYGSLRALLERNGQTLAPLDMQIAAHALSVGAVLVSRDRAFKPVAGLVLEDWR